VSVPSSGLDPVEFPSVLTAARADAPWAYRRIFEALSGPVRGYLQARGATDPEDLTSEVFLGAFRNLDSFEGDLDAFRSWIFTIAHRRMIDERRRELRRPRTTQLDPERHDVAADMDPAGAVLGELEHSHLGPLLADLRPLERDALLLRVVAGLDVEQAAAVLEVTPGHLRVLQHRALSALRRAVADEE
jgi:RNA polymerase sigma-70 factor (ECF subfamily)